MTKCYFIHYITTFFISITKLYIVFNINITHILYKCIDI
nr:MAG TPA: hypothetical protein [Caudoviricetes sp.]